MICPECGGEQPVHECKLVDISEDEELKRARRAIIQHIAEMELLKELEE